MNTELYWNNVKATAGNIQEEFPWVMSLDSREKNTTAGTVTQCDRMLAAARIVDKTHRLATAEEVRAHQQKSINKANADLDRARRRAPRVTMVDPQRIFTAVPELPDVPAQSSQPKDFSPSGGKASAGLRG